MIRYAIGFAVGVVTAALLLLVAFLRELSQAEAAKVLPRPFEPTDEAGA